jgi:hypothetical protein
MEMISVQSSNVKAYGFEDETNTLRVQFSNGLYQWINIDEKDYVGFVDAKSKGSYLHKVIEPKYGKGQKITEHKSADGERTGYLIEGTTRTTTNSIKSDTPEAHCPACGEAAQGFIPPMEDSRYVQRMQQEKEINNLETDEEAHKSFLKASGGYIEICGCGTSYFVPARSSKLKGSK